MTEDVAVGEHVLWQGRPHGVRGFLRPFDVFLLGFAGFASLFFVTALASSQSTRQRQTEPGEFAWVALFPFIALALMFFLPRIIAVTREANGASYVVTDRRVILRSGRRRIDLDLRTLPYLELDRSRLSGTTIYFAQRSIYDGFGWYGGSPAPALRGIGTDAERVYRLIADARAQANAR